MEFAEPSHLAYLLLLPVLYFLSLPPRPKRTQATAHLAQWLAARQRLARRPVRFRWLRFLLLAFAFLAVVAAHTGPRLPGEAGATDLVVLLDVSASMAARADDGGTAFAAALAEVDAVLGATPAHVDVRVGLCGETLQVVRGTREELRRRLAAVQPRGVGRVDFERTAQALADPKTAVLTITDGLGPTPVPASGALRLVGEARPNVAIVGLTVDDAWPLPEVTVRVRVANHTAGTARGFVVAEGALAEPVRQPLMLPAGRALEVTCAGRRGTGGVLVVRLELTSNAAVGAGGSADALALDDAVAIGIAAPPEPQIVVRAEGEPGAALRAVAEALAQECGGRVVAGGAASQKAGFLLVDGGVLAAPPAAGIRMLTFGTAFGAARGRWTPRGLDWDRSHPVTAGLDLSELAVEDALEWPLTSSRSASRDAAPGSREGDEVLLQGEGRALAVRRVDAGSTAGSGSAGTGTAGSGSAGSETDGSGAGSIHVAFRLEQSNLFKLAAFPQFVRRCFAASYGTRTRPQIDPDALLDPAESFLARHGVAPAGVARGAAKGVVRELPAFATEPRGLAVPLLLLGLLLLAIRVYV